MTDPEIVDAELGLDDNDNDNDGPTTVDYDTDDGAMAHEMSAIQACRYLNISRQALSNFESAGQLHGRVVGGRRKRYYLKSEIETIGRDRETRMAVMKVQQTTMPAGPGSMITRMSAQSIEQTAMVTMREHAAIADRHSEMIMERFFKNQQQYEVGYNNLMSKVLAISEAAIKRLGLAEERADKKDQEHLKLIEWSEQLLSLKQERELQARKEEAKIKALENMGQKILTYADLAAPGVLAKFGIKAQPAPTKIEETKTPENVKGALALQWFISSQMKVGQFSVLRSLLTPELTQLLDELLLTKEESPEKMKALVGALMSDATKFGELGKIMNEKEINLLLEIVQPYMGQSPND